MKYAPGLPPTDDARLREYIQKELLKISDTIDQIHLHEKSYKTPAKPQDGQVEFADGTNWNPDATNGEGLYRYDASSDTWVYLEGSGTANSPLTTKGDVWGYSTLDARIPVGTDDQVLTADSTNALGVSWQDAAAGATSPLTTKGDLWTLNFSGTDIRVPIGTNGQVLTANSAASNGGGFEWDWSAVKASYSNAQSTSVTSSWSTQDSITITKEGGSTETDVYVLLIGSFVGIGTHSTADDVYIAVTANAESDGSDQGRASISYNDDGTYRNLTASVTCIRKITGLAAGSNTINFRAKTTAGSASGEDVHITCFETRKW